MARINKNKINNKINNNDNNNNGSNKGKKTSVLTQLADVEAARQMAKSGVDPAALRLRLVRVNELLHYHCRNCKKEWSDELQHEPPMEERHEWQLQWASLTVVDFW